MKIWRNRRYMWGAVAALLVMISLWRFAFGSGSSSVFKLAQVGRGDIQVSISATGIVEPEEVVDVGAQVAGQISSFGIDKNGKTIDYGSVVEQGTVLANIDDSLYASDVAQAEAQLKKAQAGKLQSEAKLGQATLDWERAQKLGPSNAIAKSSSDAYKAAFETAKANVALADAEISNAEATLAKARRNLSYCTIKSPVNGVIIDRRVNIGQTVVSSLNAPSLFLIAKDLRRMQVWIAVNEADIGSIHPGQSVSFNVDAFPGETFFGEVGKIRLNATMTQNVVTYTVEVITDNSNGRLIPYLTANARFDAGSRKDVLLLPNAAFRWWPKPEHLKSGTEDPVTEGANRRENGKATVWIPDGSYAKALNVKVGLSDGSFTEIEAQELSEGSRVIVGEGVKGSENETATTNPFAPQFPRGRSRP